MHQKCRDHSQICQPSGLCVDRAGLKYLSIFILSKNNERNKTKINSLTFIIIKGLLNNVQGLRRLDEIRNCPYPKICKNGYCIIKGLSSYNV